MWSTLKSLKFWGGVLLVAAIAAFALWPDTMAVEVASASRGPMRVTIDEDGETRVRDRYVVSAPVTGQLQRLELDPGDQVIKEKTVVARLLPAESPLLDPRTRTELQAAIPAAQAAVDQARAERDRAAAAFTQARSTRDRTAKLAAGGAVSAEALEAADTALREADAALQAAGSTVARAESELRLARARLLSPAAAGRVVTVVAPATGVVLKLLRESESVVPVGTPLVEIGDPKALEIVADLLSTDAVQVASGAAVSIERWGGGTAIDGRVRRVEPAAFTKISALGVEEQRVNVVIDVVDSGTAARQLGDAYRVEVRIVIWEAADVLQVPVGALFRHGDAWAVFVVGEGHVRLQVVELGHRTNTHAEILSGLEAGQSVVMHPPDTLADGARVHAATGQ
jgi:HlyD family secretion protein